MPPEKFYPVVSRKPPLQIKRRLGCLVVGAENIDPQWVHNYKIICNIYMYLCTLGYKKI